MGHRSERRSVCCEFYSRSFLVVLFLKIMFQRSFAVILITTSTTATMIPITWSETRVPFISIRVNNQTEMRALNTAGGDRLVVYNPLGSPRITAHIDIHPVQLSFEEVGMVSNTPVESLTLPIDQYAALANHDEVDWFTITPQGFYPFPPENMRTNPGQFCQDPDEAVKLVAGAAIPWNVYQMSGDVVIINSISPYIRLMNDVYTMFMDEVRDILSASGFTLTTDPTTNQTLIEHCDIPDLENMLPEIEFALATPNPNTRGGSWFINDAIPHYVRINPRDYLIMIDENASPRICNLGILPNNNRQNEIGTALFKSHSVSFSSRRRSVIICEAPIL